MKMQLTVYYDGGSSGIIEFEKPAGAHPDSINAIAEGLLVAEKTGKRVSKIGRSKVNPFSSPKTGLVIEDNLFTRDQVLKTLQLYQRPLEDKYKPLFC